MANRKRNLKAKIKDDGYEYCEEFLIRRIETVSGIRYQTDLGKLEGKYVRKSFKTLKEARACAKDRRQELDGHGIKAKHLPKDQRKDAVGALELLKGYGASLHAAAAFFVKHHKTVSTDNGVAPLIDAYLEEMKERVADKTLRPTTYKDTIRRLKPLKNALGHLSIEVVDSKDLKELLSTYKLQNRANYKRYFSMFFRWAVRKKLIKGNPVDLLDKIILNRDAPEIYTPAQARNLMKAAYEGTDEQKQIVAYMALAFFGGVRPDELTRLNWKDIDLEDGIAHICAEVSKTKTARHIEMPDNLRQWLATCPKRKGLVFPWTDTMRRRWRKEIHTSAGVPLIRDGARHSMATYYLASHTIEDTIDILGHSDKVLFKHYKGLVKGKKTKAKTYFDIQPHEADKVIQLKEGAA